MYGRHAWVFVYEDMCETMLKGASAPLTVHGAAAPLLAPPQARRRLRLAPIGGVPPAGQCPYPDKRPDRPRENPDGSEPKVVCFLTYIASVRVVGSSTRRWLARFVDNRGCYGPWAIAKRGSATAFLR